MTKTGGRERIVGNVPTAFAMMSPRAVTAAQKKACAKSSAPPGQVMNTPPELTRGWARRLLALEAANQSASDAHVHAAGRVCEKLRISLARFAGQDGFTSLLRRALALARAEVPALQTVKLTADCRLERLEEVTADASNGGADAAVAIIAHLLGLLVTFIGEPLTLRLVRDAWPDRGTADVLETFED